MTPRFKLAFSLVELSIVLVILGLLVGGVLAGQSLIKAAQLRSISTEYNRYRTATMSFRDKYFALPGDMPNATTFWGKDNSGIGMSCNSDPANAGSPGTCSGDGDGNVGGQVSSNLRSESFRFWQHLSLAGQLEGSYSGTYTGPIIPGANVGATKFSGGNTPGWSPMSAAISWWVYGVKTNFFLLTSYDTSGTYWGTPLSPEDAWNIDTKLDDGKPDMGAVMGGNFLASGCITPWVQDYNWPPTYVSANPVYALTSQTAECHLWFKMQ